tara:strand:- start:1428 stop:2087 length:660 start_codon:yes stop_codon:yes gene_type:complete
MDSINFDTFKTNGVELSDTLSSWREKTNGIITKINTEATALGDLQNKVNTFQDGNNTVALNKLEQISNLNVLGNTSGSSANVAEVSILDQDTLSSNSATSLATQQSIKAYVDNQNAAQFDSSTYDLSTDGYQKLPSGFIMQWGLSDRERVKQEEEEVTFPLTFPNACLNVVAIIDRDNFESGNLSLYLKSFTTTKATFVYDSDNVFYPNTAIRWQAYGH